MMGKPFDSLQWFPSVAYCLFTLLMAVEAVVPMSTVALEREKVDPCGDIDRCMARLYAVAEPAKSRYLPVSEKEWAVARRLSEFGGVAVERLVPLLSNPDLDVAQVAAAALRNVESIDPRYLPDIVAALDSGRDLGWLPAALGRIDTPEAARQAVLHYLKAGGSGYNQEAFAVELSGVRAIPFIVQAALCNDGCTENQRYLLAQILSQFSVPVKKRAAQSLLDALPRAATADSRIGMVCMVRSLGPPAQVVEKRLLQLKEEIPYLGDCADLALVAMHSEKSGVIFAKWLAAEPDVIMLRDLAETGVAGRKAGPVVEKLLNSPDWDIRVAAARTLGYLEYRPAVPMLLKLLRDESDVVMNRVAAEALARMPDGDSRAALSDVAASHWHPRVRQSAINTAEKKEIVSTETGGSESPAFSFNYFQFQDFETESCSRTKLAPVEESRDQKLYTRYAADKLKSLSYPATVIGIGAADEAQQLADDPDGIVEINAENMQVHRERVTQVPQKALRVDGGWLVGSDRGEWGGELVFVSDDGNAHYILRDNIEDIYRLGDRYVATTGLAHLTMNSGAIFELYQNPDGEWLAARWRSLPGASYSSWFVETGELLINTTRGGSLLVSKNGGMRMAPCADGS